MKCLFGMIAFFFAFTGMAQIEGENDQKDEIQKTIITKTITKTNTGEEVDVKREELTAEQVLALEHDGSTNQRLSRKPMKVTKTTSFVSEGEKYRFEPDDKGYVIILSENGRDREFGKVREMSMPNSYLLITEEGNAFGYFNNNGDFVVETYDPKLDTMVTEEFSIRRNR